MIAGRARRRTGVLLLVGLACVTADARAQGAVGSGPLTGTLAETEPTTGVLGMGPVKVAPGITISQIGTDSNVFDEAVNPKSDFLASVAPDVSVFSRMRFLQVSAYGGVGLNYFHKYEQERSVGYVGRARVDILLSRLFPFAGWGLTRTRERPNGEIDVRADQRMHEVSGGLGFRLSETSAVYASAVRMTTKFTDAVESGVELGQALSRDNDDYNGGFRTALTPLTQFTLRGGYKRDLFHYEPGRNADTRYLDATFGFAPQASINGAATIGYQDFKAVDPAVKPHRGLTASVAVTVPIMEISRLNFIASRALEVLVRLGRGVLHLHLVPPDLYAPPVRGDRRAGERRPVVLRLR